MWTLGRAQWLRPVILALWEAEAGRSPEMCLSMVSWSFDSQAQSESALGNQREEAVVPDLKDLTDKCKDILGQCRTCNDKGREMPLPFCSQFQQTLPSPPCVRGGILTLKGQHPCSQTDSASQLLPRQCISPGSFPDYMSMLQHQATAGPCLTPCRGEGARPQSLKKQIVLKKENQTVHGGLYLQSQHFRRPRRVDHLRQKEMPEATQENKAVEQKASPRKSIPW
ncbi:hypothetical protein AAY473_033459 [Plecturocebus cupreus]